MKIQIKKPCFQNWDAMVPNEQGAFCGACAKSVIDFSNKSISEITHYFTINKADKLCGRFKVDQLNTLNFNQFYESFLNITFSKKLTLIICLTFGLWGFNANTVCAQTVNPITKNGTLNTNNTNFNNTIIHVAPIKDTTDIIPNDNIIMGKMIAPHNISKPKNVTLIKGEIQAPIVKREPKIKIRNKK